MSWLQLIPVGLVDAHRVMLPRLRAQEALRAVTATTIGSGLGDKDTRTRVMRQWARDAAGSKPQRRAKPSLEALRAMGISIVLEPVKAGV